MNTTQTLQVLVDLIEFSLQELCDTPPDKRNDFISGQIYALSECLETLQLCSSARTLGLNYDILKRFPSE